MALVLQDAPRVRAPFPCPSLGPGLRRGPSPQRPFRPWLAGAVGLTLALAAPGVAAADEARPAPEASASSTDHDPTPPPEGSADPEALARRVAELEARLALLEALADEPAPPSPPPPEIPSALNPRITVFADATGRLDTAPVFGEAHEGEAPPRLDDGFLLRETEVDFRAAVDPFVDGVLTIALEQHVPGEFHVGVEEGYALVKSLPLPGLEAPPLGLVTKVGRFRPSLGRANQLHTHDLPQTDRPLAVQAFLGDEGTVGDGISAGLFLPVAWLDDLSTLQLTLEAFVGGFPAAPHEGAQLLAHLGWTRPLGAHHTLALSVLGHLGRPGATADRLVSAELLYAWRPSTFQGAVVGAQGFWHRPGTSGSTGQAGGYAFAQAQLSRSLFAGVRYDRTDRPEAPEAPISGVFPYLSWYPTEAFRIRAGYEQQWRPAPEGDLGTAWLQVTFLFGAHPPHPYWVHR